MWETLSRQVDAQSLDKILSAERNSVEVVRCRPLRCSCTMVSSRRTCGLEVIGKRASGYVRLESLASRLRAQRRLGASGFRHPAMLAVIEGHQRFSMRMANGEQHTQTL
nr:hypothetical protein CFP56_24538 [Quercus suber]